VIPATLKAAGVVLMIGDICEFSDPVALRSKAQCEGNGHFLVEHCEARLAVNVDKLTESTYITYHEHIS